jgi:hypothetical protein
MAKEKVRQTLYLSNVNNSLLLRIQEQERRQESMEDSP